MGAAARLDIHRRFVSRFSAQTLCFRRGVFGAYGDIAWGLMVFPEVNQGCGVMPSLSVRPMIGGGDAVLARLMDARVVPWTLCTLPGGSPGTQPAETPTQEALQALQAVPELRRSDRERIIVLVSDGGATCGATDASLRARSEALRAMGVRTAVVGFALGGELSAATPMLNAIADAGGLPRMGARNRFYEANSPSELADALSTVITAAIPCTFRLSSVPPEPMSLRVSLNDAPVNADARDGYTYNAADNTITFNGASCRRIQSREATRVGVAYGCATPACVPVPEVCDGLDNNCDGMVDNDCRPG